MIGAATDITAGQPPRSVRLSVPAGSVTGVARHTTFQLAADPSPEQERVLARHEGAARFAFNQCLRLHLDARHHSRAAHDDDDQGDAGAVVRVPWSGFDFINAFNAWKRSEHAGRRFVVDAAGDAELEVTGLAWRCEVSAQVFELSLIHISEPTRLGMISYAVFCLK